MSLPLTPRERQVEKPFPIADFQEAVERRDFPRIRAIFRDSGVEVDGDYIEARTRLLGGGLEHLIDILAMTAIQNSVLVYLPALAHFKLRKIEDLTRMARSKFCKKMDTDSFEVFRFIVKKYKAPNAENCVRIAAKRVADDPILSVQISKAFKEYDLRIAAENDEVFPAFEFRSSLLSVSFEEVREILLDRDWEKDELELTLNLMKQLKYEKRRFSASIENLDQICYHLVLAGIENKRRSLVSILPLLPPLASDQADFYRAMLVDCLARQLHSEPEDPALLAICEALKQSSFTKPSAAASAASS